MFQPAVGDLRARRWDLKAMRREVGCWFTTVSFGYWSFCNIFCNNDLCSNDLCSENSCLSDAGQQTPDVIKLETGYNKVQLTRSDSSEVSLLKSVPTLLLGRLPSNCKSICEFFLSDPVVDSSSLHSAVFRSPSSYCHVPRARERKIFLLPQQSASHLGRRRLRCLSTTLCSVVLFLHSE